MCPDDLDTVVLIEAAVHEAPWTSGNFMDALKAGYDAWVFEPDEIGEGNEGNEAYEVAERAGGYERNDGDRTGDRRVRDKGRKEEDGSDVDPSVPPARSGPPATKMIGYAVVMWLPDEVHLLNLAVCASWQGRGKGRAMLHWLLCNAQTRGAGAMMLEVRPSNARAAALYDSIGFVQIGLRRDYYPGRNGREDAIVLRKHFGSE